MDSQTLRCLHDHVHAILEQAIQERVFPGAVVAISQGQQILTMQALGTSTYEIADAQPIRLNSLYDIASLTKIITATAALRLMEQGRLDLHQLVQVYLPDMALQGVTVWHLLTHTSGIDLRLSTLAQRGASILRDSIANIQTTYPPGTVAAYTNINSLLLGQIVAKIYGTGLDQALYELVTCPLGMNETQFCPTG